MTNEPHWELELDGKVVTTLPIDDECTIGPSIASAALLQIAGTYTPRPKAGAVYYVSPYGDRALALEIKLYGPPQ